ncbi:MAG: glycosyltransferase family 1 protein [Fuerstiella sp.]
MSVDCVLNPGRTVDAAQHSDWQQLPASLVVFSDDWGRHPSSCQHLIRQLLPKYDVLWINTIGTRAPRLDLMTLRRVSEKLRQWVAARGADRADTSESNDAPQSSTNLTVVNPRMWPWFTKTIDRRFNAWLLQRQLAPLIRQLPQPVQAITTLPITADLPGLLPVQSWLYYCVDDFSQWPGLDGNTLRVMDRDMIRKADHTVAVSQHLQEMICDCGSGSELLTHGVDLDHWQSARVSSDEVVRPIVFESIPADQSRIVFWGVVDRRLDAELLMRLSQRLDAAIVLVGPQQDPDPQVLSLPNVHAIGPLPFAELPSVAASADVLIMPYADLPVTRAMQPLKMKEYLATGRPVVVSQLPAVRDWADCLDVANSADHFCELVSQRLQSGVPDHQRTARKRLQHESWGAKAVELERAMAIAVGRTAGRANYRLPPAEVREFNEGVCHG